MDKPEIPWLYLAMVAIIFVRWLMAQFRKAAAKRRAYRRNLRRRWDNPEPEPPRPVVPPIPESRPVEDVPRQPESVPQTLQELFEMRRKEIAEAQRKLSPPPIPVKAPEPVEPEVVVPRAKPVVVKKAPPAKPVRRKRTIASTLKNPNELRRALVLKEVLDKPKGFDL